MKIPKWKNFVKDNLTQEEFEELYKFATNEIKEWEQFIQTAKDKLK